VSARARLIERGRRRPQDDPRAAPTTLAGAGPQVLAERAPAAPAPAPASAAGGAPFAWLALFILVLYTRPQDLVPPLGALRLAFLFGFGAAALHASDAMRRGAPLVRPDRETYLMGALLALGAASIPFSLWPGGSFAVLVDRVVKMALAYVLIAHLVDTPGRVRVLLTVLVGAGVYLAVGSIYLTATGQASEHYLGRGAGLVGGMFKDPNDLALTLVIMIALAGFLLLSTRRTAARLLYGGAIAVMLAGVMLTFSRGGILALLAAAAVGVRRLARHGRGVAVGGLLVLGVLVVALKPQGLEERMTSIVTREGDTGSIEARLTTLRNGVEILLEHPAVGVGLGNFRLAEGEKHGGVGKWNEAHNTFLQIGGELGWAGLAVYLALVVCALLNARAAAQAAARQPRVAALAHAVETALVGFLAGAMFLSQAYTWHFYILLGLTVALRRMAEGGRGPEPAATPARPGAPEPAGGPGARPVRLERWAPGARR
jgi:O-antigen ligase